MKNNHLVSVGLRRGYWAVVMIASMTVPAFAQPKVTAVTLAANPTNYSGPCPGTIKFFGKISAKGKGAVTYQFFRSDGATGPVMTVVFDGPGSKEVSTTWTLGGAALPTYAGWEAVRILSPNPMESNRAAFKLTCANAGGGNNPGTNPNGNNPQGQQPDITGKGGISIGNKSTKWGGTITLSKKDAVLSSNGRYAFNITYAMVNLGNVPTAPAFVNRMRDDVGTVVTQQTGLALNAHESKTIHTQAYLPEGTHLYKLSMDDDTVVSESNEGNNTMTVTIIVAP